MSEANRNTVGAVLKAVERVRKGEAEFPPEIVAKQQEWTAARRLARLFRNKLRQTDAGLEAQVLRINGELDRLYIQWGESETSLLVT